MGKVQNALIVDSAARTNYWVATMIVDFLRGPGCTSIRGNITYFLLYR